LFETVIIRQFAQFFVSLQEITVTAPKFLHRYRLNILSLQRDVTR